MSDKKIGRPTEDPKTIKLTVRVNSETNDKLEKYCIKKGISKADGVRKAINNLE